MATNEPQSSVSATELAQALTEALQKNTAPLGVASLIPLDPKATEAIKRYIEIDNDLETLTLSR